MCFPIMYVQPARSTHLALKMWMKLCKREKMQSKKEVKSTSLVKLFFKFIIFDENSNSFKQCACCSRLFGLSLIDYRAGTGISALYGCNFPSMGLCCLGSDSLFCVIVTHVTFCPVLKQWIFHCKRGRLLLIHCELAWWMCTYPSILHRSCSFSCQQCS